MKQLKSILQKIIFPHIVIVVIGIPVAAAMLVYSFAWTKTNAIVVYTSYVFSFYVLLISCVRTPKVYKRVKEFQDKNKYIVRYKSDVHLKVKISLSGSVIINVLYALLQFSLGFYYHSVWFYALGVYYALLTVMRGVLLRDTIRVTLGKNLPFEFRRYRFCGILLLLMNLTLAVIVAYIVWQNRGFEYHYIHTITMATYTFAALTMAIINVIKYRRFSSPILSAAKITSLVAALVSLLSLETAMLAAFGEENQEKFRQIMTGCTGAAVCTFILAMAVYMIIRATKEIKKGRKTE